jgi:hypothetical protein
MGLFSLFKRPPIIQDEFFGKLTFMEIKKNQVNSYFEGKGYFKPTNEEIEFFISADIIGPTKDQREFFTKIENSYDEIISKIQPLIKDELKIWDKGIDIVDFKKEFKLVGLSIPRQKDVSSFWDLSFETVYDEQHNITINFKDFEPIGILVDG